MVGSVEAGPLLSLDVVASDASSTTYQLSLTGAPTLVFYNIEIEIAAAGITTGLTDPSGDYDPATARVLVEAATSGYIFASPANFYPVGIHADGSDLARITLSDFDFDGVPATGSHDLIAEIVIRNSPASPTFLLREDSLELLDDEFNSLGPVIVSGALQPTVIPEPSALVSIAVGLAISSAVILGRRRSTRPTVAS